MHEPVIWAVALNSEAARILPDVRRDGRASGKEIAMHGRHARLQDLMADKPGRSLESVGNRRSGMEYASDPVLELHRAFLRSVLDRLEEARTKRAFDKLAVFASRPMLGLFRAEVPPALAPLVICEVDKNLLHLSPTELAQVVATAVFPGTGKTTD